MAPLRQIMYRGLVILVRILLLIGLCTGLSHAGEVRVFAAASLTDALAEVAKLCDARDKVVFHFAGSNMLVRQIVEGAPADVIFSADEEKLDALEAEGLLADGTRRRILSNRLVVVVPKGAERISSLEGLKLPGVERIALANPDAVPAGIYARESLEKAGLWEALKSRVIPTENVRAALATVASGNADAGIVYRTDASISGDVEVACEVPPALTPGISYPVAILENAQDRAAAERFVKCLESPEARRVFEKYGFLIRE